VTAYAGAAAVVVGTALAIWLMRPGNANTPGSGGLVHRQPRVALLVFIAVFVEMIAVLTVRGSRRWHAHVGRALTVATIAVLVLAVAGGFAWPSGLVRHYQSFNPATNITIPSTVSTPTTRPTATTKPTATTNTTPTTKPTVTTKPAPTPTT
jgi:cell division septation protein DedD